MKIGAIVQARMSSQRFRGKVLENIAGKRLLQCLLENIEQSTKLNSIVVATSTEEDDKAIVDFCKGYGVNYHCGSLENVAERFKEALKIHSFDAFVRVCGDSPLYDFKLMDKGIDIFMNNDFDVVTNTMPRTYPTGLSVEIMRSATYLKSCSMMTEKDDLEHVTKFFYKNWRKHQYKIHNIVSDADYSDIRLAIDSEDDMRIVSAIVMGMNRPPWQYSLEEIIQFYKNINP